MQPYNQHREDPEGFYLTVALVCGFVAVGSLFSGGPFAPIGIIAGIGAALAYWKARTSK